MVPSRGGGWWSALVLVVLACPAYAGAPPLQAVAERLVGADQGVLVRTEDGTILASLNADRAVHPASVTKIATALALLKVLGPGRRFETRLAATGPLRRGILEGDLVIEADGDPTLVFENAFLMLLRLHDLGVRRVLGRLAVRGPLIFDWEPDGDGTALKKTLEGRAGVAAWPTVVAARPEAARTSPQELGLAFGAGSVGQDGAERPLLVHRSGPLIRIVKILNCYSNNVFHPFSDRIGGPEAVERIARERVAPELRSQIVIDNAAGAGTTDRLSPRATVALLDALERELAAHGFGLVDVLPVNRIDPGTLRDRLEPGMVVGKTGTFGSLGASALAGVIRTKRWGRVTFAILNRGVAVPTAHRRQDGLVEALLREGGAEPWPYTRNPAPDFTQALVEVSAAR
jgi:D-alanyl-D-alanine carboxypeptidase/D-alanyl-D-alanine-endopeptidase (penicillin-binding protein 4)